MDINAWMIEEKIAKKVFNANAIFIGLGLDKIKDDDERKTRCRLYREWRRAGENTKAAFKNAIDGKTAPSRLIETEQ